MSGRLKIHPLMVLIATTTGGVVGGIAGLILAVPVTVVAIDLVSRLRKSDALSSARAKAVPLIRDAVSGEPKNGSIDPEAAAPQR
jgi:predicted PurR-regulated permease PerM